MNIFKWGAYLYRVIGLMSRTGDRGSIPGRVTPKNQKIVLGAALLNT